MNTEDDLRAGLLEEGIGMAEHEMLLIGLADDALSRARTQRRARRRRGFALAAAVLAIAGVSASVLVAAQPKATPVRPVPPAPTPGPQALLEVGADCSEPNQGGLSPSTDFAWDPRAGKYRALSNSPEQPTLLASPDGSRALVTTEDPRSTFLSWAVGSWVDAVADHNLRFHQEVTVGDAGLVWTPDGKALVSLISKVADPSWPDGFQVQNTAVHFYDPGTGAMRAVAFPAAVTGLMADGWALSGWTGNEDSLQYYLLSGQGDAISWIDQQGVTVRTVRLQTGESGQTSELTPVFSSDGRYVATTGPTVSVYDLQEQGKLVSRTAHVAFVEWVGSDRYASFAEKVNQSSGLRTITYTEHTPDGKVVRSQKFSLPEDPRGECTTYPISFGPASVFPGAFLP